MKKSLVVPSLVFSGTLLFALPAVAANNTAQMKNLCQEHAGKVVEEIRAGIFNRMTADQYRQTESLITDDCLRRFASGEDTGVISKGAIEEDSDDWFTRYVIEGKGADKPGNRRLERMRRK